MTQSEPKICFFWHMIAFCYPCLFLVYCKNVHTLFTASEISIIPVSIYESGQKWLTLFGSLQWYAAVYLSEEPPGLFLSPELEVNLNPSLNNSLWSSVTGPLLSVSLLLCFFFLFLSPPPLFFKPPLYWAHAQTSSLVFFRKWKWDSNGYSWSC